MSYLDVANSSLLYVLVALGILYVLFLSVLFLLKAWKQSIALGITKEQLNGVVTSSVLFTIVPSLAVVVGLFSLATALGLPWPWYRLSVVGSVVYELMAADMAASGLGFGSLGELVKAGDPASFGTIMYVMSFCALGGLIVLFFAGGKIRKGMIKLGEKNKEWGVLATNCFFLALMTVFLPVMLQAGKVYLLTLATSALVTLVQGFLIKKFNFKWLQNFVLANTLIIAMASSVLWTNLMAS
jgi:hypothetical protein